MDSVVNFQTESKASASKNLDILIPIVSDSLMHLHPCHNHITLLRVHVKVESNQI